MKAVLDEKGLALVRASQIENNQADEDHFTLLADAYNTICQRITHRATALGLQVDGISTSAAQRLSAIESLKEARTRLLVTQGQFVTMLREYRPRFTEQAIAILALTQTGVVQSLDLHFRLQPLGPTMAEPMSISPQEFQAQAGRRIAGLRDKKKMSQEKLAKAIGTTSASIARMENGKQRIAVPTLYAIAAALNVSPSDLLSDKGPPKAPKVTMHLIEAMRRKLDEDEAKLKAQDGPAD